MVVVRIPTDPGGLTVPDVDDRILERVRKLLTRAEHPSTPPAEAEACSEKAAALMSRYVIDQAMLDATDAGRRAASPVVRRIIVEAPYTMAKAVLLDRVAKAFRVCVAIGGDHGAGRRCTMVGFAADVAMTELLFTSLLLQATTAMLAASAGHPRIKAFRRSFLMGYADVIGHRLSEVRRVTEQEATAQSPGSSLVLVDRTAQVEKAFAEEFPHLRSLRTTVSSGSGLTAGHAAGARADLGAAHRRVGGRRSELSA
ncbi:MAG TPA: DUF2786 domain-containing protein [Mycobacteriales bacterium]|nr:DUF2786 domain-containing protein [Mycobacteriales bacterium]